MGMTGTDHQILPNLIVAWLFRSPWVGFGLALVILGCTAFIILYNGRRFQRPFSQQMQARLSATAFVDEEPTDPEAQQAFAARFDEIHVAMMEGGSAAKELRHAWMQFNETIIDPTETPLRATSRPEGYFLHLGDDTRVLAWWANIFVALGLTFTFLGIIAALVRAVDSISGGDMAAMQGALVALLTVTAAKFWTSIGGVLASVILRWFDRRWHSSNQRKLETLCDRIEYGTLFSPPQRMQAAQLHELREQTIALREFSTQLAVGIADALSAKMEPVVFGLQTSLAEHLRPLTGIQTSIDEFKSGSFDQIGKELGTAISQSAGTEMASLAAALTQMTDGLSGVNDRLEGASGQASEQIATAAREFSSASEAMTRAFATLNDRIEGMANRLASEAEAANDRSTARVAEERERYDAMAKDQQNAIRGVTDELGRASTASTEAMVEAVRTAVQGAMAESSVAIRNALDGFAGATAGIQTAFDQMRGQVAELGQALSGSAGEAAERNAEVLARAAAALEAATMRTSDGMGKALDEAIGRSAEQSSRAISAAFEAFGEKFGSASAGLVETLRTTAGRMETLSGAIERSTGAANDHAGKLADAGREAQSVATMLGRAANDVSQAASPIRDAVGHIRESVGQGQDILRRAGEEGTRNATTLQRLADSMEKTSTAAGRAWDGYHDRFAGVDESLGRVLDGIKSASGEHAEALNTHVGRIDSALAQSVERLAQAIDPLTELANALEDARRSRS